MCEPRYKPADNVINRKYHLPSHYLRILFIKSQFIGEVRRCFWLSEGFSWRGFSLNACQKQLSRVIRQLPSFKVPQSLTDYTYGIHPLNAINGLLFLICNRCYNLVALKVNYLKRSHVHTQRNWIGGSPHD